MQAEIFLRFLCHLCLHEPELVVVAIAVAVVVDNIRSYFKFYFDLILVRSPSFRFAPGARLVSAWLAYSHRLLALVLVKYYRLQSLNVYKTRSNEPN